MKKTADRPPNLRRAYFESRFGQLHCRTAFPSTGGFDELTPLVGLHDAPGSGASLSALLPLLGNDRSVYLPDLPGCGNSDGPPAPASVTDYATSVGEMLRGLRLRQIDLLGVGAGAAVAVELALWFGPGLRRLVLAQLPVDGGAPAASTAPDATGSHLQAEWQAGLGPNPGADELATHCRVFGERLAGGAAASWPAVAVGRWSWRDRLALVTVPVRVLERQPEAPTAKACLPAATIDAFAGAGDFSPRGVERNVRSLREFLDA